MPALPPDVEALPALDALAAEGLPGQGALRPFYIRLTAIAKRYLERRLDAPILEMTSAETLALPAHARSRAASSLAGRARPGRGGRPHQVRAGARASDRRPIATSRRCARSSRRSRRSSSRRRRPRRTARPRDGLGRLSLPGPAVAVGRARRRRSCSSPRGFASGTVPRARRLVSGRGAPAAGPARLARDAAPRAARARRRSRSPPRPLALARPQHGSLREDVTTQGVDIVVALDVSGSMAAEDFQPKNRLEVAKEVVAEFVGRRKSDRLGLVVFAGRSLTKSPPTTDTAVLLRQLDDVKLDDAAGRHRDRLGPRHLAHAAAPLAGEEPRGGAGHGRRQQRGRDRPGDRRRHGEGDGGPRLHDPGRARRPRPDAGPGTGPVHGRDAPADGDDRGSDRRGAAEADRGPHRRRVLPRHRLGVAAADLRSHRQAREVRDQARGLSSLPRALPGRAAGRPRRCSPPPGCCGPRACAWCPRDLRLTRVALRPRRCCRSPASRRRGSAGATSSGSRPSWRGRSGAAWCGGPDARVAAPPRRAAAGRRRLRDRGAGTAAVGDRAREGGARGQGRGAGARHLRLDGHRRRRAQPLLPRAPGAAPAHQSARGRPPRARGVRGRGLPARAAHARRRRARPVPGDRRARDRAGAGLVARDGPRQGARELRRQGPPQQGAGARLRRRGPGRRRARRP